MEVGSQSLLTEGKEKFVGFFINHFVLPHLSFLSDSLLLFHALLVVEEKQKRKVLHFHKVFKFLQTERVQVLVQSGELLHIYAFLPCPRIWWSFYLAALVYFMNILRVKEATQEEENVIQVGLWRQQFSRLAEVLKGFTLSKSRETQGHILQDTRNKIQLVSVSLPVDVLRGLVEVIVEELAEVSNDSLVQHIISDGGSLALTSIEILLDSEVNELRLEGLRVLALKVSHFCFV